MTSVLGSSTPLVVAILFIIIIGPFAVLMQDLLMHLLEDGFFLDEDGFRSTWHGRTVVEIDFDDRTRVEAFYHDSMTEGAIEDVTGYGFKRHWWYRAHVLDDNYSLEDISSMWPVVRAAVAKHGMRTGENLERLMAGTSS